MHKAQASQPHLEPVGLQQPRLEPVGLQLQPSGRANLPRLRLIQVSPLQPHSVQAIQRRQLSQQTTQLTQQYL